MHKDLENKKIVIFICTLELGGAERQAIILAAQLAKKTSAQVEVWSFVEGNRSATHLLDRYNVQYKSLDMQFWDKSLDQKLKNSLIEQLTQNKVDILIPFTYWPNYFCCSIWKDTAVEVCLWNQRDEGYGIAVTENEKFAVNNASVVVGNMKGAIEYLIDTFEVQEGQTFVIHNGIEKKTLTESKRALRLKHNLPTRATVCIMSANINERKDHATLIRAWNELVNVKKVKDIYLLIAGKKAESYHEMKTLIDQYNLHDSVRVLDFVEKIDEFLKLSDIGILSTKMEGLPNAIMEYMAFGLPVIASDLNGSRDLLGMRNQFLFPIGDHVRLSQLIYKLKSNLVLRKLHGAMNLRKIVNKFSIDNMVSKYISLLKRELRSQV